MMMLPHIASAILAFTSLVSATNPIVRKGSNFVDANTGDRFEILGVDYQPNANSGFNMGSDPLSDGTICLRDAIVMQSLGVNTIRVYNLDPTINHDQCASIFNSAGIYMLLDVNTPKVSLNSAAPWTTYTKDYLQHVFQVVEAFGKYPNLLAFVAGNENINDIATGQYNPPYVKAVIRDLKNYIKKRGGRQIPVGYAAAQVQTILQDQWNFFRCSTTGSNDDPSITDFFSLNSYSWCGNSSYQTSGYDKLVSWFSSTNTPVFFGEYGCNQYTGSDQGVARPFTEVQALYGQPMRGVFSGGLVFEYTQEQNDYGLVNVNSNKTVTLRQDFINLQNQFNQLDWKSVTASNDSATTQSAPKCSSSLITNKGFSTNFTLPSLPDGAQDMIDNGVTLKSTPTTVSVSATSLPTPVYNVQQQSLDLKLKMMSNDQSNAPSGQSAGGAGSGSGSGSGSSGSSSSSGFAAPTAVPKVAGLMAGGVALGALLL